MDKKVPFKNKFDKAKKCDKIGPYLLYASTFLLIVNYVLSQCLDVPTFIIRLIEIVNCITIVLFSIVEFVLDYILFEAEKHRREDLIDNSFASLIADKRTEGYYTNGDLESGLYKMGVNNFESCFFSYNIAKKELPLLWVKSILLAIVFIIIAISGYDEVLIFIIQLSIPIMLLQQVIKHTLFASRLNSVLSRYRSLFNSFKNNPEEDSTSEIIRDILEYETTISWANILLNEHTYNKMNALLSSEWEEIKKEYSI
jgi:hypothetical protein